MTTNLDLTGRTNGAGTHMWIAGLEYVWIVNADGKLEAQRWLDDNGIPRFPEPVSLAKVLLGSDS